MCLLQRHLPLIARTAGPLRFWLNRAGGDRSDAVRPVAASACFRTPCSTHNTVRSGRLRGRFFDERSRRFTTRRSWTWICACIAGSPHKVDRATMAPHQARVPYLDHRFVGTAATSGVAQKQKSRGQSTAQKKSLNATCRTSFTAKVGFVMPLSDYWQVDCVSRG